MRPLNAAPRVNHMIRGVGSLRAAEEITGHNYETIGEWLRRAAAHAEALTAVLVHDLHLSAVELDQFWSFVRTKGGQPRRLPPGGVR